jgi:hypothetical protein
VNHSELCQGRHSVSVRRHFPQLPVFLREEVLHCFYGEAWYSFFMQKSEDAFLHCFAPSPVADTGYVDAEPWLGYPGFLTNSNSMDFLRRAVERYSQECSQHQLVCELIRFEPVLGNDQAFHELHPHLRFIREKPIVYMKLSLSPEALFETYAKNARRNVSAAKRAGYEPLELDIHSSSWMEFVDLYTASMTRVGADAPWHFPPETFSKLQNLSLSSLWGVRNGAGQLVSACLVLSNADIGYYLLAANANPRRYKGANHLLIHHVASVLGRRGLSWLSLGGGTSSSEDDQLLFFKTQFSKLVFPLPIGFFVHDERRFNAWCASSDIDSKIFLKYRLAARFAPGRFAATRLPSHAGCWPQSGSP